MTDITPGATYTVRCKGKRFGDQVANLKAIHGQSSAGYDPETRTWTVTLGPKATTNLMRLQGAIWAGAEAVRAGEPIEAGDEEPESRTLAPRPPVNLSDPLSDWEGAPTGRA